jgi:hypothetical protein
MPTKASSIRQTSESAQKRKAAKPVAQEPVALALQADLETWQRAVANPRAARPSDILALQRTVGNQAVTRLIQTKLAVGPVGDRYEQEADRVAEQVMTMPAPTNRKPSVQRATEEEEEVQTKLLATLITPLVQRQEAPEEEEVQTKLLAQRQEMPEEEEVQTKPLVQRQGASEEEEVQTKSLVQPRPVSLRTVSPTILQRDIAKGADLPTVEAMTKARFSELLGPEFKAMQSKADELALAGAQFYLDDWSFMLLVLRAVDQLPRKQDEPDPTLEDLMLAKTIIQDNLKGAKDWNAFVKSCITDEVKLRKTTKSTSMSVNRILNEFFKQMREQALQAAKLTSGRSERGYAPGSTSSQETATAFLTARQNVRIGGTPQEYEQQKSAFATALKQMPTVKNLLTTYKAGEMPSAGNAQWKNGGKLSDSITESKINDAKNEKGSVVRTNVDNGKFKRRTDQADEFIKAMVEPHLLATLDRPKVVVHLKYNSAFRKVNSFRAYQDGNEVHVAQDEDTPVIVHEVGHYLEDQLPSELWHDIRLLMEARHAAAGGGKKAAKGISSSEGGYKGKYLDVYMAKAYGGRGSTEVMSMTMEYLADPSRIKTLLDKDPQQAAIILRGIRPKEYAATDALRPFDKFLPNKQP